MSADLVTGYKGKSHITASQMADFYRGIYGDAAIIDVGDNMALIVEDSSISISSGEAVFDGRIISIPFGEFVILQSELTSDGEYRNDLILLEYTKNTSTGVETVGFTIKKGTTETNSSSVSDPIYDDMDIRKGYTSSQKAFARIKHKGGKVETEMLVDVMPTIAKIMSGSTKVLVLDE
jgi:hypothetical protein